MSGAEPFLLAAATGMQVIGAIQQGNAQAAANKQQAAIAERNKILADQDRQLALRTAEIAADDRSRENRRKLADVRAAMGSTGLELAGSPLDALADGSLELALDVRRIEFEGKVRGREGAIEMINYGEEASASRIAAKNARTAGYTSAGAALLSGGSKTYKSFDEHGYFK